MVQHAEHRSTALRQPEASFQGLRHRFAQAFMQRGILGWGNAAWPGGEVTGLRLAVQRLVPGDGARAQEMYAGQFGRRGGDVLGELGWLKHFSSSGKALHALYAMELLRTWAKGSESNIKGAPSARSLMALIIDGYGFATKGPKAFAVDYLKIVTQQTRRVYQWQPDRADEKLLRALALGHALTSCSGLEALRPRIKDAFDTSLPAVVLADGGIADGHPESLLRLLLQMIPLRAAMQRAHEPIPASLNAAIERMLPMLRMLRHGNGALAQLRGSQSHREATDIVLQQDEVQGAPLTLARHSGFARIETERSLVISDTTPVAGFTTEISIGGVPVLSSSHADPKTFRKFGTESPAELLDVGQGYLLIAGVRLRNASYSRNIFVETRGADIRVEDGCDDPTQTLAVVIDVLPGTQFAFDGTTAALTLANGEAWQLRMRGGRMVQTAEAQTLVLMADGEAGRSTLNWALQRR